MHVKQKANSLTFQNSVQQIFNIQCIKKVVSNFSLSVLLDFWPFLAIEVKC